MNARKVFLVILLFVLQSSHLQGRTTWDNDGQHPVRVPKKGPTNYGDYINNPGEGENPDWQEMGQRSIQSAIERARRMVQLDHKAKNVIFFMGDGMGLSTITAGRVYMAQSRNITGEDAILSWERFPYTALSRTYATDILVSDSANTASAMMCGEKCRETIICANQFVVQGNCSSLQGNQLKSVLHHAIENDLWTGIVTSTRITHASPSTNYAHSAHRDWETDADLPEDADKCTDIASQLIDNELNQKIRVILGGGRYNFRPNGTADSEYPDDPDSSGKRLDGRNLIEDWMQIKRDAGLDEYQFAYVDDRESFDEVDPDTIQYLMGLFEPGHMKYEVDKDNTEPSMADMVEKAIRILQRSNKGYFLFVEGGRIDTSHHDTNAFRALNETVALSDAVQRAMDLTEEDDTLIITTADHSHTFSIAGYPARNADIFGWDYGWNIWGQSGDDGKPYTTLQYSNGPGYYLHRTKNGSLETEQPRVDLTEYEDILDKPDFIQDTGIPIYSETHAGEDVAIYASGPMAHLFHGTQEQNYIAHVIKYALCIGENTDLCDNPPPAIGECVSSANSMKTYFTVLAITMISTVPRLFNWC